MIKDSGLRAMYEQEKGEKGQTRIENLEELVTATRQFSYNEEDEDLMPLQAFLSQIGRASCRERVSSPVSDGYPACAQLPGA